MIMVRTPFRVSFFGGGSDVRDFYVKNGYGAVLSTTINKYMYIMIHGYFHKKIRIKYSKLEDVDTANEVHHPIVRECLRHIGVDKGVEIASIADVPAGTGMGSSSAFTVGLLHALFAQQGQKTSQQELARLACEIEINRLQEPIGKQDQYAVALGGLNFFTFKSDETVQKETDVCPAAVQNKLQKRLILFYVGSERSSSEILKEQLANMSKKEKYENCKKMVKLAESARHILSEGLLDDFGRLLHEGWMLKKTLASKISSARLDQFYEKALAAGALGGKLLGAGGGGFLLFYCPPETRADVKNALADLRQLDFCFEKEGTRLVFSDSK